MRMQPPAKFVTGRIVGDAVKPIADPTDAAGLAGAAPEVVIMDALEGSRSIFRDLAKRLPVVRTIMDVEAFILNEINPAIAALSRTAVSEFCKHDRQVWNVFGTSGRCKDCGIDLTDHD